MHPQKTWRINQLINGRNLHSIQLNHYSLSSSSSCSSTSNTAIGIVCWCGWPGFFVFFFFFQLYVDSYLEVSETKICHDLEPKVVGLPSRPTVCYSQYFMLNNLCFKCQNLHCKDKDGQHYLVMYDKHSGGQEFSKTQNIQSPSGKFCTKHFELNNFVLNISLSNVLDDLVLISTSISSCYCNIIL